MVSVVISQNLETNYGKKLSFSQRMNGVANIVTKNICLVGNWK